MRSALPADARLVAHWRTDDAAFLAAAVQGKGVWSVVRIDGGKTEIVFDGRVRTAAKHRPLASLDLEGAITGSTVVLFHTESRLAASALSFDTGKLDAAQLSFILTGIAPGMWDIWRDGWLEHDGAVVRTGEAVLAFTGRPGSYFIRRL